MTDFNKMESIKDKESAAEKEFAAAEKESSLECLEKMESISFNEDCCQKTELIDSPTTNSTIMNHVIGKFVIESLAGQCPLNRGFFQCNEEEKNCCKCAEKNYVTKNTLKYNWCPHCYVKQYCRLIFEKDGFIIMNKISGRLLFNNTSSTIRETITVSEAEIAEELEIAQVDA